MGKLDDFFLEFMPQKPHETNSAMHLEDQSCFQFSPSEIENTDTSNFDVSSFSCIYNKNTLFEVHGMP